MTDVAATFAIIKEKYKLEFSLKREQSIVLEHLADKENVLAVLPTGYGKSLMYACLPLLLNEVNN